MAPHSPSLSRSLSRSVAYTHAALAALRGEAVTMRRSLPS
jgi:hypothetical protein